MIWVWPNDRALENAAAYAELLARGVDGLNINDPAAGVAAVEAFVGRQRADDRQLTPTTRAALEGR